LDRVTRIAVHTLGCRVNQVEGEAIAAAAAARGARVTEASRADVVVLNTCAVTRTADLEAGQIARRVRRENPGSVIVLTGCYAQTRPREAARLPVDYVIGHGGKDAIAEEIPALAARGPLASPEIRVDAILRDRRVPDFRTAAFPLPGRTRPMVKVQDGCDVFCAFCIVPHARGLPRSVPAGDVLAEVAGHAAAGAREVVLTGPHIGSWGRDLAPPGRLADLLGRVRAESGLGRVRLSSMEPSEFDDAVISEIAGHPDVFCDHLHVPLQSGSDAVLRRMRRPYDAAAFRGLVARFARALPDVGIGTDVIAGFPGETEADFAATLALLEAEPVSFFHVFPFSPREGTPAARYPDRPAPEVIRERAARLRELGARKTRAFCERFLGRTLEVLLETPARAGGMRGFSRNYIPVEVAGADLAPGAVVQARVASIHPAGRVGAERIP
jgi:threonylcarbamoyladenosine tRNA methylthiotransferase MtaB